MITWAERAKAAISQSGPHGTAKTDETSVLWLLTVSSVRSVAVSAMPEGLSSVSAVHTPAVLEKHASPTSVTEDPDRWCWPHSLALNSAEICTFAECLRKFADKGLPRADGEALADKLVERDRDRDDRRVCMECKHLTGHGSGLLRCRNWLKAGVAIYKGDSQLPADFVVQLQRCEGFQINQLN